MLTRTLTSFLIAYLCTSCTDRNATTNKYLSDLHFLPARYPIEYGRPDAATIEDHLRRVRTYLEEVTPIGVADLDTGEPVTDLDKLDHNSGIVRNDFAITTYEWGVTYSGMLAAEKATGDRRYGDYTRERIGFLAEVCGRFQQFMNGHEINDKLLLSILKPQALDNAGSMCATMIKVQCANPSPELRKIIDNYIYYIMYHEYRLPDGTFARKRPQYNTVWLDDLYMSVPAIAQMGVLTGEEFYFDEAVKQISQFTRRMFVPEKGLYMHGWVEGVQQHPAFFWGRANGWAILSMTEVLEILPEDHPQRDWLMQQYLSHISGIASYQSGEGLWHQLLDRTDSYLETSASAIFIYCIAKGINNGWLDPAGFGPVAVTGWNAVSQRINERDQVESTCVGTGMAFDPVFYYHRPVNVLAAHGYGPVLLAGAEVITLLNNFHPHINDSSIQFYKEPQRPEEPIFGVYPAENPLDIVSDI